MSRLFDARADSPTLRRATLAFVEAFLEDVLPDLRLAARGCGYALTVHGSLARDIDLVAIPWEPGADEPELLVNRLCGVLAGKIGRATHSSADWGEKPHGRRAVSIFTAGGMVPEIDLSIMPRVESEGDKS